MKILGFDIGITSIGWAYIEDDALKGCGGAHFYEGRKSKKW